MNPSDPNQQPSSPATTTTPRIIGIPIDLSDESSYALQWAVQNYLRPSDSVTLLHVRPTSILYGADWGSTHFSPTTNPHDHDHDFETFTTSKISEVAKPLDEAGFKYKVHLVKDHDMKERLCLEIERLGMSVVIMGSRGFGASRRRNSKGRLGSVSDYCVHHCVCPVVVVRYPDDKEGADCGDHGDQRDLSPVPEDESAAQDVQQLHLHEAVNAD